MNDQPSPLSQINRDRSSSPKRKKVRQKYAPKACVSCRRSKLKCSGDNPCLRCRDNGRRCFFSEDQTAAEALQNLSRPSLSQQPSNSSNGGGLPRRNIMPRHLNNERRASDASAPGLSLEARMTRIESMMEALLQERAMYTAPSASIERDKSGSDAATSMTMIHPVNSALSLLGQPSQSIHPQDAIDPLLGTDTTNLRVGNRSLGFPHPAVCQGYINTFFREFQSYYPCVDEQLFRLRSEKMLARAEVHPDDACFLALNYIIFALHATSTEPTDSDRYNKPAGWHWLQLADEVVGKRQLVGHGDISLAQFLLFKAIYCTLVDQPSLAYNTIGLASRYALQYGLNLQSPNTGSCVWETYERSRVFWNILIVDRRISLSCNRPYILRDLDIGVERPSDVYRRDIVPILQPSVPRDMDGELDNDFLDSMIHWSRFAGSLWDSILAAHAHADNFADKVATFDAAIDDFITNTFTGSNWPTYPLRRCQYVRMCFDNLRLVAQRAMISFQQVDGHTDSVFKMAITAIAHVRCHGTDNADPYFLRHQMGTTLAGSLLVLCSVLIGNQRLLGLDLRQWIPIGHHDFEVGVDLLRMLAQDIPLAQRVLLDFDRMIPVVQRAFAKWSEEASLLQSTPGWSVVNDVIPSNVAELLPYQEQIPDIRFPMLYNGMWATNGGYLETDRGFSTWDEGLEPDAPRSSVLWI